MAYLKSKTLFFTTSPRTPLKMVPEIEILSKYFSGRTWDKDTQVEYIKELAKGNDFEGKGSTKEMAFSARDRINRAPKSLGFVDLKPTIQITQPGKNFISGKRTEEVLLRQLLKFQIPSPYHREPKEFMGLFGVKPYLEIFRLIYELGTVSFDELMIFGMQITHYSKFESVVREIRKFRRLKAYKEKGYKVFRGEYLSKEIENIYQSDIEKGKTKTRESKDTSLKKFIKTKASNLRDYTDACFRYLRATGMVEISQRGHSLSITPEKKKDVKFFLETIDREPVFVNDEDKYKEYLFDEKFPVLYSDDKERLSRQISNITGDALQTKSMSLDELKDLLEDEIRIRKGQIIQKEVEDIKQYKVYSDVMTVFEDIKGNMPDINETFNLAVEVTMQSGQKQYEMEGEPVSRHLAKLKAEGGKEAYCLFIAPKINPSCIAFFYALHKMNIAYYGGSSVIVPMELNVFINMLEQSYRADYVPDSIQIKEIFQYSMELADKSVDENEWYEKLKEKALNWL